MSGFPIRAVVFDWAGTMVDFGCMAPVKALRRVFADLGVELTETEARRDMGMAKLDHLRAILAEESVAERYLSAVGHPATEVDVLAIYGRLETAMAEAAGECTRLIPGAVETVAALRGLGVRIGSGTGYTRAMMAPILAAAAEQGYAPDVVVCAGETPSGRPSPLMLWRALVEMDAWPAGACVKVDDAEVGIAEGKNAGCWAIGVAASGNGVGLDRDALAALPADERERRIGAAARALKDAGADIVINDVSELIPALHTIAERMSAA